MERASNKHIYIKIEDGGYSGQARCPLYVGWAMTG